MDFCIKKTFTNRLFAHIQVFWRIFKFLFMSIICFSSVRLPPRRVSCILLVLCPLSISFCSRGLVAFIRYHSASSAVLLCQPDHLSSLYVSDISKPSGVRVFSFYCPYLWYAQSESIIIKTHSKTIVLQDYRFYLLVFYLSLLLFTVPRCKTIVLKDWIYLPHSVMYECIFYKKDKSFINNV